MGFTCMLNYAYLLIFTVLFYERANGNSTVYGGVGWTSNSTIYVVRQNATWYSARSLCKTLLGGYFWLGGSASLVNTFQYILQQEDLKAEYIWLGYIKSGYDEDIYTAHSCPNEMGYKGHFERAKKTVGTTECIMFNMSDPNNMYVYGDCHEKHPYTCIVHQWGLESNNYTNVSVVLQSADLNVQSMTSSSCSRLCDANFKCVAAVYSHDNNLCLIYNAIMNGDFETEYRFVIEPSYNSTSFCYKEWRRSYIKIIYSDSNNTDDDETTFHCFDDITTEPGPTTMESGTDESVIGGSCQCSIVGCTVNRTIDAIVQEQIEEIKQILSVDKQQLSSTVRKKTCANDTRQSSVAMGTLGVAVLVVVFGAVMSADLLFFVSLCKSICLKVKNRLT